MPTPYIENLLLVTIPALVSTHQPDMMGFSFFPPSSTIPSTLYTLSSITETHLITLAVIFIGLPCLFSFLAILAISIQYNGSPPPESAPEAHYDKGDVRSRGTLFVTLAFAWHSWLMKGIAVVVPTALALTWVFEWCRYMGVLFSRDVRMNGVGST